MAEEEGLRLNKALGWSREGDWPAGDSEIPRKETELRWKDCGKEPGSGCERALLWSSARPGGRESQAIGESRFGQ